MKPSDRYSIPKEIMENELNRVHEEYFTAHPNNTSEDFVRDTTDHFIDFLIRNGKKEPLQ